MSQSDESLGKVSARVFRDLQARVAINVRELRREKGWTQEEAAFRSEMATRVFQRIEAATENLKFTTIARLCAGFAVDPVRLVSPDGLAKHVPPKRRKNLKNLVEV